MPLCGVDVDSAHSYLLRVAGCSLLLDCGWDDSFDAASLSAIETMMAADQIDAILLSHSSLSHVGALAYLEARTLLKCPVYATLPVQRMGELTMYDAHQQWLFSDSDSLFTLDDIDAAFAKIVNVKYSEDVTIEKRRTGDEDAARLLVVTPHPSGHSLGGTVWRITVDNTDTLLYAVSYHHSREKHVDSGVLEAFQRPSLLIADSCSFGAPLTLKRKAREESLCALIDETCIVQSGIALLPTDSAGRLLELLLVIYAHFESARHFDRCPLILLSHTCHTLLDYARSQLEWMSDSVQRFFDLQRNNPFEMSRLTLVRSFEQCKQLTGNFTRPACILSTSQTLNTSLALQVFEAIHASKNAGVILTQSAAQNSLANHLLQLALMQKSSRTQSSIVSFAKRIRVPLEGAELSLFLQKEQMAAKQRELESSLESVSMLRDMDLDDNAEEEEEESGGEPLKTLDAAKASSALSSSSSLSSSAAAVATQGFFVFPLHSIKTQAQYSDNHQGYGYTWPKPVTELKAVPVESSKSNKTDLKPLSSSSSSSSSLSSPLFSSSCANRGDLDVTMAVDSKPLPPAVPAVPSKSVVVQRSITLSCQLSHVDMNGLSDERAWRATIAGVKPRRLILVHGAMKEKEDFKHSLIEKKILAPLSGDNSTPDLNTASLASMIIVPMNNVSVTLSSERLFRASLNPLLLSKLRFSAVSEFDVAHLRASLRLVTETGRQLPQLLPASTTATRADGNASSYFLGNIKFPADYRRILAAAGFETEYYVKDGVLLAAGGSVRIRKASATQISLSGLLSDQYFAIRSILYRCHTVIT